jgi:hypothetical protein
MSDNTINTPPALGSTNNFAAVAMVEAKLNENDTETQPYVMILDTFPTASQAQEHCRAVRDAGYNMCDLWVVGTRMWIPRKPPSNINDVDQVDFQDKILNTIMNQQRKKVDNSEQSVQKHLLEYMKITNEHNNNAKAKAMVDQNMLDVFGEENTENTVVHRDEGQQQMRKATPEEMKQVRAVMGKPQSTPPPGIDLSQMQKITLE